MAWEGYQSAGTSGRDSGKPGAGLRNLAGFPILMRGPSAGQTQALVRPASPPPGLQLSTHLRGSSRGSRPAPARLPIPGPGGDGRAGERRAPRPGGRSGPRGCAGGGRRVRAQQKPVHAARAGFSARWQDRGTAARLLPAAAPPRPNQIGPQRVPSRPLLNLIGHLGSGGSSGPWGGGASSALGRGEEEPGTPRVPQSSSS